MASEKGSHDQVDREPNNEQAQSFKKAKSDATHAIESALEPIIEHAVEQATARLRAEIDSLRKESDANGVVVKAAWKFVNSKIPQPTSSGHQANWKYSIKL